VLAALRTVLVSLLFLVCPMAFGEQAVPQLNLALRGSVIDLKAEGVPLAEVLRDLSGKVGFLLQTPEPLTEPVSCDYRGVTLEQCLRRLMSGMNYALIYKKNEKGGSVLSVLMIVGKKGSPSPTVAAIQPPSPPLTPDTQKAPRPEPPRRYERSRFEKDFADEKKLSKTLAGDAVSGGANGDGLLITQIAANSPFKALGLRAGDLVANVNGTPVESVMDLILAVRSVVARTPPGAGMVMINRQSQNSSEPLYIDLR
jgi:hypothetical protein